MEGRALTVIYESLRSVRLGHTPASPLGFASLFSINPTELDQGMAEAPTLGSFGVKVEPLDLKMYRTQLPMMPARGEENRGPVYQVYQAPSTLVEGLPWRC